MKIARVRLLALVVAAAFPFSIRAQTDVRQLTTNTNEETWGIRNSATCRGKLLWVDDQGSVIFFDGITTNVLQEQGALGGVDEVVFILGSGSGPNDVIGVWRRGTDSGWLSVNGAPPIPVTAANPINPLDGLNAEGVAVADGSIFMALQAGTSKHVFKVDPATGQGTDLTGSAQVPGLQGRLATSHGQAAWAFQDNTNNVSRLQFYDGTNLNVLEPEIQDSPDIALGRIVYLKQVSGMNQVFLYDSTAAPASPSQVTTDATGTNEFPRTDGQHLAWMYTFPGATNADLLLYGGVQLTTAATALPIQLSAFREHPFQLNRGQLFWEDNANILQYDSGSGPYPLDISPSTSFGGSFGGTPCCVPWLSDGYVAWTGLSSDGGADREVFLLTATPPVDAVQPLPPLSLQATPGANQVTLQWDRILGATSYNLYVAYDPAVHQTNYSSVAGGRKFAGVTNPFVVSGLTNRVYFLSVSAVAGAVEGPNSPPVMVALWAAAVAPRTNYCAVAAGLTNRDIAYVSGGRLLYQTTNGGVSWSALAGSSQGLDVRALAVDGPRVYAATRDIFGVGPSQILRSPDSGVSWTAVVPDGGQPGEQNKALAIDPLTPSRIYAADFHLPTMVEPQDSFVIRSTDSGTSWTHLPDPVSPLGAEIRGYALAIDPANPAVVYAGGTGTPNLVRSSDYGTNWTDVNAGQGYVYALAIDPVQTQTLYAGVFNFTQVSRGILKSTNSGAAWFSSNVGMPQPLPTLYSLLLDPRNPNQFYAGSSLGVFASLDGAQHWTLLNGGLPTPGAQWINALSVTASHQLLAATQDGLYRLDLSTMNVPVPTLAITRSGGSATLSWPATANMYSLESAASLAQPVAWESVPYPVTLADGQRTVVVGLSNSPTFYRLSLH
jgi:hypothetical protein